MDTSESKCIYEKESGFQNVRILREMHTSLYDEVGSKYGLERGDSIVGRNVQHLHKRDYIRKLTNDAQKADIQKLIAEYQEKLEYKSNKLHAKEQELEQITKDAAKARSVIQPFRNHKVDFTPPQITGKVPLFGTDKWIERQNLSISKQFTEIVRKIESLYRNDAARQVETRPTQCPGGLQRTVSVETGE